MSFNKKKFIKTSNNSLSHQAFRKLSKNKLAVISIAFLLFIFLFNFIGPIFSPYSYNDIDVTLIKQPPSFNHLLGTDDYGRDVLTRLMYAGRISLTVGLASMLLSLILGSILGCISGYYGGIVDNILMRVADILMSIPGLPLLIIIAALLSELKVPSDYRLYIVMLMLSFVGWPSLARLIRGQVLSLREQNFMKAADILGLSDRRKIFHHLLPNTFPLLIVVATLSTADGILSESSLSFLGLGVIPPTPSWGNMINAANNLIDFQNRSWLWIPPGLAIFLTIISINLLGDALRDALDPKMKGR
ncbi:oligopeptide ABC transporter permease [Clostridium felsineum]|uniref:Oligopeptide transport system permease protein OppC n=1 Tax=Clostridium felsineum TaxID=36839 RepID=A0A1S8KXV2_9CLOT|nr:oligopeptide ABC transporter permease [Clostridium felsineum]MCR3758074.1 ABC transporter permease [Clostridium felsineum]URZ03412.1 Oligopeptide transport system permease protein OppC [Clostridium felsineum]URZ08271.1 Oligopeptide transport system permease protein OppC [Clostridium felsineum]URZ13302.1 Oligopeptide transport system permease protein OppC [Clostridium felsineum]URZ14717.1 Oligopeptide transport system permease protein OppC [Clostridium felsineum DSM 794]